MLMVSQKLFIFFVARLEYDVFCSNTYYGL